MFYSANFSKKSQTGVMMFFKKEEEQPTELKKVQDALIRLKDSSLDQEVYYYGSKKRHLFEKISDLPSVRKVQQKKSDLDIAFEYMNSRHPDREWHRRANLIGDLKEAEKDLKAQSYSNDFSYQLGN
jgi:hypothetical protein